MKSAIMQPYFFPYIGYWQLINAADKFILLDDVNYIKKGWINRNKILLKEKEYLFTLPIQGASQNKLIRNINLDNPGRWKNKFLKTVEAAYKKALNFNPAFNLLYDILNYNNSSLSGFVTNSIKKVCNYLGIKTIIVDSSSIYNSAHLKKEEKIISICKQESCVDYINPEGGNSLYDKKDFAEEGIKLQFIKSNRITYNQFENDFIPNLSIIDVLMFNHKEKIQEFLQSYILI